ncbi:hypothetical protein AYI68_g888 [Smittium mucronatum]|uniref:BLOC-1-related complex subunit 5 n=1 Tax=Smittium mucronatum TaxID=133383 RepID=A0A1R0H6T9_9FUNG|nr:hypothetical protein AYI68_g888 [Smittium mucronatum]
MGNKNSKLSNSKNGKGFEIYSRYDEENKSRNLNSKVSMSSDPHRKAGSYRETYRFVGPYPIQDVEDTGISTAPYSQFNKREIGQVYQRKIGPSIDSSIVKDNSYSDQMSIKSFGKRSASFANNPRNRLNSSTKNENSALITVSTLDKKEIHDDQLFSIDEIGQIKPLLDDSGRNRLSDFFFNGSSYLNSISSFSSSSRFVDLKPGTNINEKDLCFITDTLKESLACELSSIHSSQDSLIKKSLIVSKNCEIAHSNVIKINNQLLSECEKLSVVTKIGKQAEKTYELIQEIFHDLERLESLLPVDLQLIEGDVKSQNKYSRLVEAFSVRKYNNSGREKQIELLHHSVIGKCANYLNEKHKSYERQYDRSNFDERGINTSPNYAKFSTISSNNIPNSFEIKHDLTGPEISDIESITSLKNNCTLVDVSNCRGYQPFKTTHPESSYISLKNNTTDIFKKKLSPKLGIKNDTIHGFLPASSRNISLFRPNVLANMNNQLYSPLNKSVSYNPNYTSSIQSSENSSVANKHKRNSSLKISDLKSFRDSTIDFEETNSKRISRHSSSFFNSQNNNLDDQSNSPRLEPTSFIVTFGDDKLNGDFDLPKISDDVLTKDTESPTIKKSSIDSIINENKKPEQPKTRVFNPLIKTYSESGPLKMEETDTCPNINFNFKVSSSIPSLTKFSPARANRYKARPPRVGLNQTKKPIRTSRDPRLNELENNENLHEFPAIQGIQTIEINSEDRLRSQIDMSELSIKDVEIQDSKKSNVKRYSLGTTLLLENLRKLSRNDEQHFEFSHPYNTPKRHHRSRPVSLSISGDYGNYRPIGDIDAFQPRGSNLGSPENGQLQGCEPSSGYNRNELATYLNKPIVFSRKSRDRSHSLVDEAPSPCDLYR